MAQIFLPILGFLEFFLIVIFFGARVGLPLVKTRPTPSHLLIGSTVAIAAFSFLLTLVGFAGGLRYTLFWTLAFFHLVLFWRLFYCYKWTRFKGLKMDWSTWKPPDLQSLIFLWLLIIFQAVMLINSIAPFINPDAEVSHYLFLKNYIADGHIGTLSWNAFSYYPQAMELAVSTSFARVGEYGPQAANMCFWAMQLLLLGWIIDFSARRGKTRTGYFLATAVSGIFYWPVIAYSGYVDGAVTLFVIAGVFSYFDWLSNREKSVLKTDPPENSLLRIFWRWQQAGFTQLIVPGLFFGTACAAKYSALPLTLLIFVHLVWILIKDNRTRKNTAITFLGFLIFFLIPVTPWYGRNLMETGNPFFPFLRSVFGGPELTLADDVNTWSTWGDIAVSLRNYVIYPIKLAFFFKLDDPFSWIRVPYMYMSWLFALAPLSGLFLLHRRLERIAAIWCFVFFSFAFFIMNVQTRYFLPFTILSLWLVVEWLDSLASNKPAAELSHLKPSKSGVRQIVAGWIVFIIILIPFATQIDLARNHLVERLPYLSMSLNRAEYEESIFPSAKVFQTANELSSNSEQVCIFSLRTYRLDGHYMLPPEDVFESGNPFQTLTDLKEGQVKYLLVESRIRRAAILINYLFNISGDFSGPVLFKEEMILNDITGPDLSRQLVREFLKTLGGQKSRDENGNTVWKIDISRFSREESKEVIVFLALVKDIAETGTGLAVVDETDSWELYEIQ